jgi:prepilin-type processing-associated H-X9-DG protein
MPNPDKIIFVLASSIGAGRDYCKLKLKMVPNDLHGPIIVTPASAQKLLGYAIHPRNLHYAYVDGHCTEVQWQQLKEAARRQVAKGPDL